MDSKDAHASKRYDRAQEELVLAVERMLKSAVEIGSEAEVEARFGTWSVHGDFRPGIHVRAIGTVQRMLDAHPDWDGTIGWVSTRDVFFTSKQTGETVRCELRSNEGAPTDTEKRAFQPDVRCVVKKKLLKTDASAWLPFAGKKPQEPEALPYGVRFALATERRVVRPAGSLEAGFEPNVGHVRYKRRRSWLWGPFRYDLTVVWASGEQGKMEASLGGGSGAPTTKSSKAMEAEVQLCSGVPSSVELEVEFDPSHPSCNDLFGGDTRRMAQALVTKSAEILDRRALLSARPRPTHS